MELADVTDSKSVDGDIVWVRVPPPAPYKNAYSDTIGVLILLLENAPHFCRGVHFGKMGCVAHDYNVK